MPPAMEEPVRNEVHLSGVHAFFLKWCAGNWPDSKIEKECFFELLANLLGIANSSSLDVWEHVLQTSGALKEDGMVDVVTFVAEVHGSVPHLPTAEAIQAFVEELHSTEFSTGDSEHLQHHNVLQSSEEGHRDPPPERSTRVDRELVEVEAGTVVTLSPYHSEEIGTRTA
mmetsp:Transcript_50194/g.92726  ORF Transcript_50194/g.92726 Transcript_50194/m.92726 type:complete len:170 (-) Transcript_50194:256-765(-)